MKVLKTPAFKYAFSKAVLQYGLPTAVICGILYKFVFKAPGDMSAFAVAGDLYISIFVTCFICQILFIPSVRGDAKKGKLPDMSMMYHTIFDLVPSNMVLQTIVLSLYTTLVLTLVPSGIMCLIGSFVGEFTIPVSIYWLLKSIYSGIFISIHMYHAAGCAANKLPQSKE